MNAIRWQSSTRYYVAQVQCNLFGEWELMRAWGGLDSRRGGCKAEPAGSEKAAHELLQLEYRRRAKRGYALTR